MERYINLEKLLENIILLVLIFFIGYGLVTGKINNFLHIKFNKLLYMTILILVLILFFNLGNIRKPRHSYRLKNTLLISLAMVLVFFSFTRGREAIYSEEMVFSANTKTLNSLNIRDNLFSTKSKNEKKDLVSKYSKSLVEIDDSIFLRWYTDLYFEPDEYRDVRFKMRARVFKGKSDDFVVLGRMGMVCCMADLQLSGFIYKGEDLKLLRDGAWYDVVFRVKANRSIEFNDEFLPYMTDVKFESADPPKDEFVYFNYY